VLPTDGHVHTEWSWDTVAGSMERTCGRALQIGLASVAFTEHADYTRWVVAPELKARMRPHVAALVAADGRFSPPPLQVDAYLECVQRCRERFPGLRILTGMELGEPHWHPDEVAALTAGRDFDRLLGSVHSIALDGPRAIDHLYRHRDLTGRYDRDELMRRYLAEVLRLAGSTAPFGVLAHIDFPVRNWPGPDRFDPAVFEEEYRAVLAELASSGRALEVNTVVPLASVIVAWWYEAGGDALTFGSDAHRPDTVARDFAAAAAMAEAAGFHPAAGPYQPWRRRVM
jgi:histidinol-phosphatase (PHP family)